MNGDLKQTFILRALTEYLSSCETAMAAMARKMNIGVTGEGIKSLSYRAMQSGGGAMGSLSFKEYLRMVDMGAGRSHPLGGLSSMKVTLLSEKKTGSAQVRDKTRKPKKFYSKTVYGRLTWLQNELLYGYTETVIETLKNEMK